MVIVFLFLFLFVVLVVSLGSTTPKPIEGVPAPGTVVQLKSGGPLMTVRHVDPCSDKFTWCIWFPKDAAKPETCSFETSMLVIPA